MDSLLCPYHTPFKGVPLTFFSALLTNNYENSLARVLFLYPDGDRMSMHNNRFYKTAAWVRMREAYIKSVGGLCEECLRQGLYVPGEIVHHKEHLTPENVTDPEVSLGSDNLELLCRSCHKRLHGNGRRYDVDMQTGRVST